MKHGIIIACMAAIGLSLPAEAAGRRHFCGTADAAPRALAKSAADFPAIDRRYSVGKSVALMVRVSFPDAPYPLDEAGIKAVNDTVNRMYRDMSRNTFEFDFRMFPEIIQAPNEAAYYGTGGNIDRLYSLVESRIKAGGWIKGRTGEKAYSVFVASFPETGVPWLGISSGPGDGANYLNGKYNAAVTVHELGHAISLPHAYSVSAGSDIFGTPGNDNQHDEYGNLYDIMGDGLGTSSHFNVNFKWKLGWMDAAEVLEVKNTGTYRLYSQDNGLHKDRLVAIRLPSTDSRYAYWFEYRSAYRRARTGAAVMFEGFNGANEDDGLHILDMTPGSLDDRDLEDAVLVPGKTIKDKYGTASFRVLGVNTGTWNENAWADLEITIPGSIPVTLARAAPGAGRSAAGTRAWSLLGRSLGSASPTSPLARSPILHH